MSRIPKRQNVRIRQKSALGERYIDLLAGMSPWRGLVSPPYPMYGHTAVVAGNKLFAFGGKRGEAPNSIVLTNYLRAYDITTGEWLPALASGATAREYHAAVTDGSKVFIYGGNTDLDDLWEYDITGNTWTQLTSSPVLIRNPAAVRLGGLIYVIGHNNLFYSYNISTGTWTALTSGITGWLDVSRGCMAIANDTIYAVPGTGTSVYEYSVSGDSWSLIASAGPGVGNATLVGTDDALWLYGGKAAGVASAFARNELWRFDLTENEWVFAGIGPRARELHTAVVHDGKMLMLDGKGTEDGYGYDLLIHDYWALDLAAAGTLVDDKCYAVDGGRL